MDTEEEVLAILQQAQAEAAAAREVATQQQESAVVEAGYSPSGESQEQRITKSTLQVLSKQTTDPQLAAGLEAQDRLNQASQGQLSIIQQTQAAIQQGHAQQRSNIQEQRNMLDQKVDYSLEMENRKLAYSQEVAAKAEQFTKQVDARLQHHLKYTSPEYVKQVQIAERMSRGFFADGREMPKSYYKEHRKALLQDYNNKYTNLSVAREQLPNLLALQSADIQNEAAKQVRQSQAELEYARSQVDYRRAAMVAEAGAKLDDASLATWSAQLGVERNVLADIISTTSSMHASTQVRASLIQYRVEQERMELAHRQYKNNEAFADAAAKAAERVNAQQGNNLLDVENVRRVALSGVQSYMQFMESVPPYSKHLLNSAFVTPSNMAGKLAAGEIEPMQYLKAYESQDGTVVGAENQRVGRALQELWDSQASKANGYANLLQKGLLKKGTAPKDYPAYETMSDEQKRVYNLGREDFLNDPRSQAGLVQESLFHPPADGQRVRLTTPKLEQWGMAPEYVVALSDAVSGTKLGHGTATSTDDVGASVEETVSRILDNPNLQEQEKQILVTRVLPQLLRSEFRQASTINSPLVQVGIADPLTSVGVAKVRLRASPMPLKQLADKVFPDYMELDPTDELSMASFYALMQQLKLRDIRDQQTLEIMRDPTYRPPKP